jgi:hypothetical protein
MAFIVSILVFIGFVWFLKKVSENPEDSKKNY